MAISKKTRIAAKEWRTGKMNDPLEKLLKKNGAFVLRQRKRSDLSGRCAERDSRGVYHGAYSVQFQQPRGAAHNGSYKSCLESKKRLHLFARRLEKRQDRTATVEHRR